jgi:toxin ParE1/3/4
MRLRLSRLAQSDLAAIFAYGLENYGGLQAIAYSERIEVRFRQLLDHPKLGRVEPDLHRLIRSLDCDSHRIHYSLDEDTIVIRRILHKSVDVKRWLE